MDFRSGLGLILPMVRANLLLASLCSHILVGDVNYQSREDAVRQALSLHGTR